RERRRRSDERRRDGREEPDVPARAERQEGPRGEQQVGEDAALSPPAERERSAESARDRGPVGDLAELERTVLGDDLGGRRLASHGRGLASRRHAVRATARTSALQVNEGERESTSRPSARENATMRAVPSSTTPMKPKPRDATKAATSKSQL